MNPSPDQSISFFSSPRSQAGKTRWWVGVGALLGIVTLFFTQRPGTGFSFLGLAINVVFFGTLWYYLQRRLRPGEALVTLDDTGIVSPLFTGKQKQFTWAEIETASCAARQNVRQIEFKLVAADNRSDRRNFWNGINYARPSIPLTMFDEAAQENLLAAVGRHLQARQSAELHASRNELGAERAFQARLKNLAPTPWLTYALVFSNAAIWLFTLSQGAGFIATGADKLLLLGGNAASEVQKGEWWRLLSALFLHSGFMHLAMNMIGLVSAGVTVERIYGRQQFALIYFGAGLAGSALSLHFSAQQAVSVGASGAVFGVTGALLVGVFQHREKLPETFSKQTLSGLSFFILYALAQGFAKQGIDNAAHIGGLLSGCLLAFILPERFDLAHFAATVKRRTLMGSIAVLAATAGLATSAPPAAIDQMARLHSQTMLARALDNFFKALGAVKQDADDLKAGRLSEREVDDRSRSLLAPRFAALNDELAAIRLPEGDPRTGLLKDMQKTSKLMLEMTLMESVYPDSTEKPEPADPQRAAAIERELEEILARLTKTFEAAKSKQGVKPTGPG